MHLFHLEHALRPHVLFKFLNHPIPFGFFLNRPAGPVLILPK